MLEIVIVNANIFQIQLGDLEEDIHKKKDACSVSQYIKIRKVKYIQQITQHY